MPELPFVMRPAVAAPATAAPPPAPNPPPWAALLARCYRQLCLPLPALTRLDADAIPQPYRRLLVHSDDMTPTLERSFGEPLQLRVLGRDLAAGAYRREVVLKLADSGRPVEYGVIGVHLDHLPPGARPLVLAEEHPFGRILEIESIAHLSWPQAFFAVRSDAHISRRLGCPRSVELYGRRNVLVDARRRLLAEVIEIVAPVPAAAPEPPESHAA